MIRSLRRKFVWGALSAFAILMIVILGGTGLFGYIQMERSADRFLLRMIETEFSDETNSMLDRQPMEKMPPELDDARFRKREKGEWMRLFGYRLSFAEVPMNYCVLNVDENGALQTMNQNGFGDMDDGALQDVAEWIVMQAQSAGKIDAYKYRAEQIGDAEWKIVLLDISMQAKVLAETLTIVALIGVLCELGLFLIMLPFSKRLARSFAANAEKQKQFITNAGHDVKTPVAIIQSNLDAMELLQGESKWSRNIRSQTVRLTQLIQQLLFAARMDERKWSPNMQSVDWSEMIASVLETYSETLMRRNLTLHREIPANAELHADRESLRQLLHLLLDNATAYANEGGVITVRLEKRRSRWYFTIANTVERLPSVPPEGLFDRFYRDDSARTQASGGCGIGLSSARAIAQMHRGKMEAFYDEGNVVRFVVELPK